MIYIKKMQEQRQARYGGTVAGMDAPHSSGNHGYSSASADEEHKRD